MIVDIDGQRYEWNHREVRFSQACEIEDAYGRSYSQWAKDFDAGFRRAQRVLFWVLLKQDQPDLKIDDFDPVLSATSYRFEPQAEPDPTGASGPDVPATGSTLPASSTSPTGTSSPSKKPKP